MAQVVIEPEQVKRFAEELQRFNRDTQHRLGMLQARFAALGDSWQDQEHTKFSDEFKDTVKALGLDVAKAEKDAQSQAVKDKVEADIQEAKKLGFSGTPGFLVNGVPVKGAYPVEYFDSIISRLEAKGS